MFAKLLKNEFRATVGYLAALCLGALGAGTMGGLAIQFLVRGLYTGQIGDSTQPGVGLVICMLLIFFAVLALGACGAASVILLVVRFYRSRFTDEGYLIFTLPVNTHQILLSSLVSMVLEVAAVGLVCMGSVVLMVMLSVAGVEEIRREAWSELADAVRWFFSAIRLDKLPYALATFFSGLSSGVWSLISIMLAITIGAVAAKKHKVLTAVAVYYGIQVLTAMLGGTIMVLTLVKEEPSFMGFTGYPGVTALLLSIAGYFLMHYLVTKKLNLP